MSDLVTRLSVLAEDDGDRYPAHVKKLAEAAASRIAALEAQLAERADDAEAISRTGAVKALDEDDYEEITNAAGIAMRRASRGIRGQVITVQDSFDWWVMKETERRILSTLDPAEPEYEVEPAAWQYRYRPAGTAEWSDWADGKKPDFRGASYEAEERPLYAASAERDGRS